MYEKRAYQLWTQISDLPKDTGPQNHISGPWTQVLTQTHQNQVQEGARVAGMEQAKWYDLSLKTRSIEFV